MTVPSGGAPTAHEHPEAVTGAGEGRFVQRVANVLEYVASRSAQTAPGVVEIARGVGLEKSVVSRTLRSLVEAALLTREEGLGYRVGPRLFALGAAAHDARLVELGHRAARALAGEFGERSEVYVRAGSVAMTVATASPDSPLQVTGWVGRTYPLPGTAAGRALLWDHSDDEVRDLVAAVGIRVNGPNAPRDALDVVGRLAADRARGFCLAVEEVDGDLMAVAVPVRGAGRRVVASLAVSGPHKRVRQQLAQICDALTSQSLVISHGLGGAGATEDPS